MPMSPENRRRAAERMRALQARRREANKNIGHDTPALAEATTAVLEVPVVPMEPPTENDGRVRITEYLIRSNGQGQMVSLLGPCLCGKLKREWHTQH